MKDVKKTSINRENSSKRMRRRRRNMGLYGFIVAVLVLGLGLGLSCTVLFNVNIINVGGDSDKYSVEQIVEAAGIKSGDNLIRMNCDELEKNILDNLLYIESATVQRDFPATVIVNVESCIPAFNISYEFGAILLSQKGKILENGVLINESLPTFYGYEPSITAPGNIIETEDNQKDNILNTFTEIIINKGAENIIKSVDMTDKSNIIVKYFDGNVFKMGSWNDIEYKLSLAEYVMTEQMPGKVGYITMIGSNQCSFRNSDGAAIENISTSAINPTDENVQTVTTTIDDDYENDDENEEESTEYLDPDEELFREHDELVNGTEPTAAEDDDDYDDDYDDDDYDEDNDYYE